MTKTLLLALIALLFFTSRVVCAQLPPQVDTRAVSQNEISAFNAFYLKLFPTDATVVPEFSAKRQPGEKKWTVRASVFAFPERGYRNLCKLNEYRYQYDDGKVWREDSRQLMAQVVWLDEGADCSKAAKHIALNVPLPDVDVIDLLTQGRAVLKQAAIMLRGNTECSLIHIGGMQLTDIGTGLYHHEEMLEFGYAGGEHDRALLLVRKVGKELTTWDIHCPPP
jgi:hypothetical protein